MAGFFARGTMKPPYGASVNWAHPFAQGHLLSVLFNDPGNALPTVTYGTVAPRTISADVSASISWASNREGAALQFADQDARLNLGTNILPTANVTILVVRQKTDTTLRNGVVFGIGNAGGPNVERCIAHIPHTDGLVYWYFGGVGDSAPNLLTVAGLSFSTTVPERWIFSAGDGGSSIWQNGIKVASQSTPVSRSVDSTPLYLNDTGFGSNHGDLQQFNFFAAYDYQWSDELCRWWSAEPYAHLYPPSRRRRTVLLGSTAITGLHVGQKALMYALGNVARGGATRGQYHDARVYVAIDGTHYATARPDDTTRILDGSLTITDVVDNTPNTCRFMTSGFIPTEGQEIVITLGSKNNGKRLFGGHLLRVTQGYVGTPANAHAAVDAIDYSWRLNRRLALRRYTTTSASTIAADLIASFTTELTARHVQPDLEVLDEITFTNQTVSEALTQLAKRVGGYWYIDYLADLHLYVGTETVFTDPTPLTATHPTLHDVTVTRDLSQFTTRVYYEGGGVNALTEVAAGETILPVEDAAWYSPSGGVVTTGQQRILYTSVEAGGAGSLIGPGASPAAAPSATIVEGAGVTLGTHDYAVTFITGSGESLPGPREPVTTLDVSTVADPTNIPIWLAQSDGAMDLSGTAPDYNATTVLGIHIGDTVEYAYSFSTSSSDDLVHDTALSPSTGTRTILASSYGASLGWTVARLQTFTFGLPAGFLTSGVTWVHFWRRVNGGAWSRILARTAFDVYYNGTTTQDSVAPLGGSVPTPNAVRPAQQEVHLTNVPLGGTGVTSRKIYRTAAGGSQLKLVATLADNTTTTYTDTTADGSLGADVPISDTSGLAQPEGQINAGSTTVIVAGPGAFSPAGGWAIIGNGQQVIRYSGISGTTLTGVPASGLGAITATIVYNSTVTAAAALLGIPASGSGAILYSIKKGDPINVLAQVDQASAQTLLAALVGGDGVQEHYLQDRRLSLAEATARATVALAQRNQVDLALTFKTRDCNTGAGRTISVNLPDPMNIAADFTIQSVSIGLFSPNILPTYEVRAAATQFSGDDLLRLQAAG